MGRAFSVSVCVVASALLSSASASAAHRAQLGAVLSGECLSTNADAVELSECDETARLSFTPSGNRANRFTLQFSSSLCLQTSELNPGELEAAACAQVDAQRFEFEAASLDAYRVRAVAVGTYLTVASEAVGLGALSETDPGQLWHVQNQDLRDPAIYGRWSDVKPWPHIAVSAANLPDGRVLTFSGSERETWPTTEFTYSAIYDPSDGTFTEITHGTHNMFCAHLAMTADGNVFVNGGRNQKRSPWTSLFDYSDQEWTVLDNMASGGRWYPTTVALTDGDMLTSLGTATNPRNPERWDARSQKWRVLSGIDFQEPVLDYTFGERNWWPLLHVAPQGMLFHSGPTPTIGWVNPTGNGSYEDTGLRVTEWYPKHGTTVMYDAGKIITAGGWIGGNTIQSSDKVLTIDLNGTTPVIETSNPMHNARKFHNGVLLPDGRVAVVGGNTSGRKFNDQGSVHSIEIWDPTTGQWFEGAEQTMPRTYHSVALLLPDGRVLSAGGGYCSGNTYCNGSSHRDGEIYWPDYLFNSDGTLADRPVIEVAPGLVENGAVMDVRASTGVARFTMVRMGATTHGLNTDVRFLPIEFSDLGSGDYRLSFERNPNTLTPGYWMLFALSEDGVPSQARMVRVTNLEVQYENIGEGARTRQSSLAAPEAASANALDGDLRTRIVDDSTATTSSETEAFWEVDLYSV
ncbi:MAG: galactose oxidase-like domain-containing protein, partial [Myxococcota bacterium]